MIQVSPKWYKLLGGFVFIGFLFSGLESPETASLKARYRFALKDASYILKSGNVWLYHYSHYGLRRHLLTEIVDGQASVELSQELVKNVIQPHPNTDAYVIVLEFPANHWYRSSNIVPNELFQNFIAQMDLLGEIQIEKDATKLLILPAYQDRIVTLIDQNDKPIVGETIPVSIYLYDNRCGAHTGLPLGTYTTNKDGELRILAPMLPLSLDFMYEELDEEGFAGQMYRLTEDLKVPASPVVKFKIGLNFPEERYQFHIKNSKGIPIPDVTLSYCIRANGCGLSCGGYKISDSYGNLTESLSLQTLLSMRLIAKSGREYRFSENNLATLFREKSLTIVFD